MIPNPESLSSLKLTVLFILLSVFLLESTVRTLHLITAFQRESDLTWHLYNLVPSRHLNCTYKHLDIFKIFLKEFPNNSGPPAVQTNQGRIVKVWGVLLYLAMFVIMCSSFVIIFVCDNVK